MPSGFSSSSKEIIPIMDTELEAFKSLLNYLRFDALLWIISNSNHVVAGWDVFDNGFYFYANFNISRNGKRVEKCFCHDSESHRVSLESSLTPSEEMMN